MSRFVHIGMMFTWLAISGCHLRPLQLTPSRVTADTAAEEKEWQWFFAEPDMRRWDTIWRIESGAAKVTLTGRLFHADLFLNGALRYRISGSRDGNRLNGTLDTEGSDVGPAELAGEYEMLELKDDAYLSSREAILLSYKGSLVVGLTRFNWKPPPWP